jgi:ADP-heptose:LPS heptosyltransferase
MPRFTAEPSQPRQLRLPKQADSAQSRRIGIVWAAGRELNNPVLKRDYARRTLPAEALELLLRGLRELNLISVNLQVGPDREELAADLAALFDEAMPSNADFLETGHWIEGLQAVISVDTAMAHQAGAQGRPCWVLLPWSADPRWLRQRSDTPWYPSLTLLRQGPERLWAPVIQRLLDAIAQGRNP